MSYLALSRLRELVDYLMPETGGGVDRRHSGLSYMLAEQFQRNGCHACIKVWAPLQEYDALLAELRELQPEFDPEARPGTMRFKLEEIAFEIEPIIGEAPQELSFADIRKKRAA